MLDESMFEDIHEIAENSAYLKAVEEKDVSLEMLKQLPPYEELKELEDKLRSEGKLSFGTHHYIIVMSTIMGASLIYDYDDDI